MRIIELFLDLLYPPKCPFCGRVLEQGEEGWCASCQDELAWTEPGDAKTVEFCETCLSPLWYKDSVRKGMHRYKFEGGRVHAKLFGQLMAQCLQDRWTEPVDISGDPQRSEQNWRGPRSGFDICPGTVTSRLLVQKVDGAVFLFKLPDILLDQM